MLIIFTSYSLYHMVYMYIVWKRCIKPTKTNLPESRNDWYLDIFDDDFVAWIGSFDAIKRNFEQTKC